MTANARKRRRARWLVVGALLLAGAARAPARTFSDILGTEILRPVGRALGESIGRALPVISASPGVVYTFDPETGAFERETTVLGQLFLERPEPVGRRKWNLSLSYQRVKIDTFEGNDIEALKDVRQPIIDPRPPHAFFTVPLFGIDLDTHELSASATYGLTDDLDVNLTVPLLYSEFRLKVVFQDVLTGQVMRDAPSSTKAGVGDIFLRGKYRLVRRDWAQVAAGLVLRVPTGNEDNFQGTGNVELAPMLYAAAKVLPLGRWTQLRPYVNGGINFNADDVDRSEARWGVGLDGRIGERLTIALAFLGRHPFRRIAPPGFFDLTRCAAIDQSTGTCNRTVVAPLLGIENRRPDFYDVSIGGRVTLWRDTVYGFASASVPLNDDGFRSNVIPLAGVEATF